MTGSPPPNGSRFTNLIPLGILAVTGLIAWGSTTAKVDGQEKRIDKIEISYVSDRDMGNIATALSQRLGRIESQLDELNRNFRRPAQ